MNPPPDTVVSDATDAQLHRMESLNRLFSRLGQLSSLPSSAVRIIDVAQSATSGGDDLLAAVECDPALASRILRTVNSAHYGLRHQIGSLKQAITLLGFEEIRNLALTVYVARQFENSGEYRGYSRQGLWNHMVATATIARLIARICCRDKADEAYLAGLLHDVGLILIDQHLRRHFCEIVDRVAPDIMTSDMEQQVLTFDHTQLGEFVAWQWHFPESITVAIGNHHSPDTYDGPHRQLLYVVTIANYLASRKGITSLGIHNVPPPSDKVLAGLGLKTEQLASIWEKLDETLDSAESLASV